ncbi:hypothetical protein GCM10009841_02680 [Microlunatus panaciterrae]
MAKKTMFWAVAKATRPVTRTAAMMINASGAPTFLALRRGADGYGCWGTTAAVGQEPLGVPCGGGGGG